MPRPCMKCSGREANRQCNHSWMKAALLFGRIIVAIVHEIDDIIGTIIFKSSSRPLNVSDLRSRRAAPQQSKPKPATISDRQQSLEIARKRCANMVQASRFKASTFKAFGAWDARCKWLTSNRNSGRGCIDARMSQSSPKRLRGFALLHKPLATAKPSSTTNEGQHHGRYALPLVRAIPQFAVAIVPQHSPIPRLDKTRIEKPRLTEQCRLRGHKRLTRQRPANIVLSDWCICRKHHGHASNCPVRVFGPD